MEKSRSQKKRMSIAACISIERQRFRSTCRSRRISGTEFCRGASGSREIAGELDCSRTVILTARDLLYAEGYLESTPRGGVTVASVKQAQVNPARGAFASEAASTAIEIGPVSDRWRSVLAFEYARI
jgi:GntR family transcriptional regulator/MocR family aminotransferase